MTQQIPLDSLKPSADRLAELLTSPQENRPSEHIRYEIAKLKQELGLTKQAAPGGKMPYSRPGPGGNVGIWMPTMIDERKFFVRDPNRQDEFTLWANIERIPPKSTKKRIILIGESVARGFLYDPFFTPASYLEEILTPELEPSGAEVIDLAKTNCSYKEVLELCTASTLLEPDAVVIFAGNNWMETDEFSEAEKYQIIAMMAQNPDTHRLQHITATRYRKMAVDFVRHGVSVFQKNKIPLVIIIPEFNLLGWKCSDLDSLLAWPGEKAAKWLELKEQTQRAFTCGEIEKARELCNEMIRINCSNPLPYQWMAEYKLKNHQVREAWDYFRLAHDTKMLRTINVPGVCSVIQEALRNECRNCQVPSIDLPAEFGKEGIPGHDFFIDYCHLTDKGIRIGMALTARALVSIIRKKDVPVKQFLEKGSEPTDSVKAWAHFFAAIHNAHKGQPRDILMHHCKQALHYDNTIAKYFHHYMLMASRHAPWSLSQDCEALTTSGQLSQYQMLIQPTYFPIMDIPLVDTMVEALKTEGLDAQQEIETIRITEHGIRQRKINLLESYYHLNSYTYAFIFTEGFYRAYDAESCFYLVGEAGTDVALKLTYRVPNLKTNQGTISLKINNTPLFQLPAAKKWQTHEFQIPGSQLQKGINHLVIRWPTDLRLHIPLPGKSQSPGFDRNETFDPLQVIYPVYGEIHTFST